MLIERLRKNANKRISFRLKFYFIILYLAKYLVNQNKTNKKNGSKK